MSRYALFVKFCTFVCCCGCETVFTLLLTLQVPSHWFEYFARSPQVVSQWARHHITGERVPTELLAQALQSSKPFPAIDLQTQILYSAVDQVSMQL